MEQALSADGQGLFHFPPSLDVFAGLLSGLVTPVLDFPAALADLLKALHQVDLVFHQLLDLLLHLEDVTLVFDQGIRFRTV
jgi:hypothetical protein